MRRVVSVLLILSLMLAGCGTKKQPESTGHAVQDGEVAETADPVKVDFSKTDEDMFTQRDHKTDYDENKAVQIRLNGTSAEASASGVKIDGSVVTIQQEAVYVITGSLTNGMIIVDAPDSAKLQLVFNGVDITSETSAALYILEADKVFVTLAEGSTNTLANGGSFHAIDDNHIDAALFSKQDLTLNGTGTLQVESPVGHGIVCKDDLVITGGSYEVNAASHGLDANDSVRIGVAALTIDAGKDAVHAENEEDAEKGFVYLSGGSIRGEAEGDGIAASGYMQVSGGVVELLVGGGSKNATKQHSDFFGGFMGGGRPGGMGRGNAQSTETEEAGTSMKGLKAENSLLIADGNITIDSADDAIHSNASVIINGGTFAIASGDDAIHAEDTLTVTAGKIHISESYEGLEALHIDVQGGDIKLVASDDGLNAAGGTDQSGTEGGRDGMFGGGRPGGMGGRPGGFGGMGGNSNGSIKVSGGALYIQAAGDGIDANGTLEITGGHTTVVGPIQGDTATLDYDKTGVITGGTFIGTGSTMMAQSFSDSTQGVIAVRAGSCSAGTEITLKDSDGKVLISRTPELDFAVVILSSPQLIKGETYTLVIGAQSETVTAS